MHTVEYYSVKRQAIKAGFKKELRSVEKLVINMIQPDKHLTRIANIYDISPEALCEQISEATGDSLALVSKVIIIAASHGFI